LSNTATDGSQPTLKRSIGPIELTLYGLGSMLGSGIYALIGQAAGIVGNAVWLSFLAALCAALLTAMSYASLGSRYPRAGGAAYVTERAFGRPVFSFLVGLALVCSGLTSVATQSRVFSVNLAQLFGWETIPIEALALGFLLFMAGVVFRGIRESMWFNVICTVVEASGLLIVIAVSLSYWGSVDYFEIPPEKADVGTALLILQGSILTFFAFIGFEDTYNVAEEVKNPERTIPIALVSAMLLATGLYIAVAISVVSVAGRGHGESSARLSRICAGRNHHVRGRQYGARQLRDGLADAVRHVKPRSPARGRGPCTSGPANAAHRHSDPVCDPCSADAVGDDQGSGIGDRAVAVVCVCDRQRVAHRLEAAGR
jgi:amino acid transporter